MISLTTALDVLIFQYTCQGPWSPTEDIEVVLLFQMSYFVILRLLQRLRPSAFPDSLTKFTSNFFKNTKRMIMAF